VQLRRRRRRNAVLRCGALRNRAGQGRVGGVQHAGAVLRAKASRAAQRRVGSPDRVGGVRRRDRCGGRRSGWRGVQFGCLLYSDLLYSDLQFSSAQIVSGWEVARGDEAPWPVQVDTGGGAAVCRSKRVDQRRGAHAGRATAWGGRWHGCRGAGPVFGLRRTGGWGKT
jgi:hypothetical protein